MSHWRFHYFQHLLFSYCFVLCVCVRFFFSAIFHVRTCIRAYRYLSQYKRLCRFVGTANKMATQPMLRVGHYRIYSSKIALWRGYQLLFVPWVNAKELFSMYLVAATIKKTQKSSKSLSWKNVSTLQNQFSFSSMNWRHVKNILISHWPRRCIN